MSVIIRQRSLSVICVLLVKTLHQKFTSSPGLSWRLVPRGRVLFHGPGTLYSLKLNKEALPVNPGSVSIRFRRTHVLQSGTN